MRVISGTAKSRKIKVPRIQGTRPTLDNVREALFNILGEVVRGKSIVDLYAGSGSLGIEALSRGAKSVTFVDSNPKCAFVVRDNLKNLGFSEQAVVLNLKAGQAIERFGRSKKRFDIVILDPPYGMAKKSLNDLAKSDILKTCSFVIVEHYKKEILPEKDRILTHKRTACYGDTCLSFYYVKSEAAQ